MQRFTELQVWQRSHALALRLYALTAEFPNAELYGLVSQIRRSAVSVAANIAEGSKRASNRDYARILNIAESSLAELECLQMLARDLGYLSLDAAESTLSKSDEIARMLAGLRRSVGTPPG